MGTTWTQVAGTEEMKSLRCLGCVAYDTCSQIGYSIKKKKASATKDFRIFSLKPGVPRSQTGQNTAGAAGFSAGVFRSVALLTHRKLHVSRARMINLFSSKPLNLWKLIQGSERHQDKSVDGWVARQCKDRCSSERGGRELCLHTCIT